MTVQRFEPKTLWLLWGRTGPVREEVERMGLQTGDWHQIPLFAVSTHLRAYEGPLRNPKSRVRLRFVPGGGWWPTDRDKELARARGFEV